MGSNASSDLIRCALDHPQAHGAEKVVGDDLGESARAFTAARTMVAAAARRDERGFAMRGGAEAQQDVVIDRAVLYREALALELGTAAIGRLLCYRTLAGGSGARRLYTAKARAKAAQGRHDCSFSGGARLCTLRVKHAARATPRGGASPPRRGVGDNNNNEYGYY